MELFSSDWFIALLTIIFIDLVLAGDNAIVIGLAARRLPKLQQKKAILWGTAGAISIRILATVLVVYLPQIPWLQLAGGLLLLWIAYKLLVQDESGHEIKAGATLGQAIYTIVVADAAMGLDNVIAVAGAANHDFLLVIIGLLVSIPIVVWGSTLFIKLIEKFPWIIYLGSGVLAYTAAKMITHEKQLAHVFEDNKVLSYSFMAVAVIVIIVAGLWRNSVKGRKEPQNESSH